MKNRASNYRLAINVKLDYEKRSSRPTSRPFARRRPALASFGFKSAVLKLPHLNQVEMQHPKHNKDQSDEGKGQQQQEGQELSLQQHSQKSLAFHVAQSGEKQQHQNEKKKGQQYQYDRYDQYEQLAQRHGVFSRLSDCPDSRHGIREYDRNIDTANDSTINSTTKNSPPSVQLAKQRKEYKQASILVINKTSTILTDM